MDKIIKTIILDDNSAAVSSLKEQLEKKGNIKVVNTFTNGEDALKFVVNNNANFDLIIMDILLSKLDGLAFLEELKKRNINKRIIVLSSLKDDQIIKECSNYNISHYILKPYNIDSLIKRIEFYFDSNSYLCNDSINVDYEINQLLHNLGIPSHIRGFKYIREGVMILYNSDKCTLITKEIYPQIALKYNTTPTRVERAIRHAIEVCCIRGDYSLIEELFGYSFSAEKARPTNSEFLSTIADRIKMKERKSILP